MGIYKEEFVTKREFNRALDKAERHGGILKSATRRKRSKGKGFRCNYLWEGDGKATLLTDGHLYVWEPENDSLPSSELRLKNKWTMTGSKAFAMGQACWRAPDLTQKAWCKSLRTREGRFAFGKGNFLYGNPKFEGRWNECWGYDLNSAFTSAMRNPMPDTSKTPKIDCKVGKGEIGFTVDDGHLEVVETGRRALWVFAEMESPFAKFIERFYSKKEKAKNRWERNYYKRVLNLYVGYLQLVNPFLRTAILHYAEKAIKSVMDADTVVCNTDSIVSLRPREDLEIGTGLGQFKFEHHGLFAYIGRTAAKSQWRQDELGNDRITLPGTLKAGRPEGFDLLKGDAGKDLTAKMWRIDERLRLETNDD